MSTDTQNKEPLPIWFFVGVILFVYGILIIAGQAFDTSHRVVGVMKADACLASFSALPGYWWGGFMLLAGAAFTAIGVISNRRA